MDELNNETSTYHLTVEGVEKRERIIAPSHAAAVRLGVKVVRWWQSHGDDATRGRKLSARLVGPEGIVTFEVDRRGRCRSVSPGATPGDRAGGLEGTGRRRGLWPFGRREDDQGDGGSA